MPRLIEVLKSIELRTPAKMSGTQKYLLKASQNCVYAAAVRAKGIASTFFYVPFLDAVQQVEQSGKAAELAPAICQQTYEWLMYAATDAGVMDVLQKKTQLFEDEERRGWSKRLNDVLDETCWWERRGKHSRVLIVDERTKNYLQVGFQKAAIIFHRHTARCQREPCPLAPDDSNWAKHGGELTNLLGAKADAMNNAMLTGCHVESVHGTPRCARAGARALCR